MAVRSSGRSRGSVYTTFTLRLPGYPWGRGAARRRGQGQRRGGAGAYECALGRLAPARGGRGRAELRRARGPARRAPPRRPCLCKCTPRPRRRWAGASSRLGTRACGSRRGRLRAQAGGPGGGSAALLARAQGPPCGWRWCVAARSAQPAVHARARAPCSALGPLLARSWKPWPSRLNLPCACVRVRGGRRGARGGGRSGAGQRPPPACRGARARLPRATAAVRARARARPRLGDAVGDAPHDGAKVGGALEQLRARGGGRRARRLAGGCAPRLQAPARAARARRRAPGRPPRAGRRAPGAQAAAGRRLQAAAAKRSAARRGGAHRIGRGALKPQHHVGRAPVRRGHDQPQDAGAHGGHHRAHAERVGAEREARELVEHAAAPRARRERQQRARRGGARRERGQHPCGAACCLRRLQGVLQPLAGAGARSRALRQATARSGPEIVTCAALGGVGGLGGRGADVTNELPRSLRALGAAQPRARGGAASTRCRRAASRPAPARPSAPPHPQPAQCCARRGRGASTPRWQAGAVKRATCADYIAGGGGIVGAAARRCCRRSGRPRCRAARTRWRACGATAYESQR